MTYTTILFDLFTLLGIVSFIYFLIEILKYGIKETIRRMLGK